MCKAAGYKNSNRKAYYLFIKAKKCLIDVDSDDCYCFLRSEYGLLDKEIKEVIGSIKTAIWANGIEIEPHVFSYYDELRGILYISDLDSQIYKMNGDNISIVDNGSDGIVFESRSNFTPTSINIKGISGVNYFEQGFNWKLFQSGLVYKHIIKLANFAVEEKHNLSAEEQKYLLAVYIYSLFFESILQDKPILCFEGVKESGKSFLATLIGKVLFGIGFLSSPLSESRRDFHVTLSKNYYVVFDNLDSNISGPFLNDLCTIATSGEISSRKLYTNNEEVKIVPRVFVVITSREPKFQRDDFVDRLLLFNTGKIRRPQGRSSLNKQIMKHREEILAEMLINLNSIVKLLKQRAGWNPPGIFRLADWELFGKKIHSDENREYFVKLLEKMNKEKTKFSFEGDPLFILLTDIVYGQREAIEDMTASELYKLLEDRAESIKMRDFNRRYHSSISMARRVANIREELSDEFDIHTRKAHGNITKYSFSGKSEPADG